MASGEEDSHYLLVLSLTLLLCNNVGTTVKLVKAQHPSRREQDVPECEEALLVAGHEKGDRRICIQMSDLSVGESKTSEASRVAPAIADS